MTIGTQSFEFTPNGSAFATLDPRNDLVLAAPRTPLVPATKSDSSYPSTKRPSTSPRPPAKKPRMPASAPTAKHRLAKAKSSKPSKQTSCEGCRRVKTKCDKTPHCRACKIRDEPCIWTNARPTAPAEPDDVLDVCPRASKEILRLRALVASLAERLGPGALDFSSEDEEDCEDGGSSIATSSSARSSLAAPSPSGSGPPALAGPEFSASSPSLPKPTHQQNQTLTFPVLTSVPANFAPMPSPSPAPFSFATAPTSQAPYATTAFGPYPYPSSSSGYFNYALGYSSYSSSTSAAMVTPLQQFAAPPTAPPSAATGSGGGQAYYPEVFPSLRSEYVGGPLQPWPIPSGY